MHKTNGDLPVSHVGPVKPLEQGEATALIDTLLNDAWQQTNDLGAALVNLLQICVGLSEWLNNLTDSEYIVQPVHDKLQYLSDNAQHIIDLMGHMGTYII